MSKMHKTAQGKAVDMAALRAKNEKVRAVGNMNVNSRGDVIDSHDNVINDATKRVNEFYMKGVFNRRAHAAKTPAPDNTTSLTTPVTNPSSTLDSVIEPPQPATPKYQAAEPDLTPEEQEFDQEPDPLPKVIKTKSNVAK